MIITIEGKAGEGKNLLSKKITQGSTSILLDEYEVGRAFWNRNISKTTDFVIIDDVKDFDLIYSVFNREFLTVDKRGEKSFIIEMPHIIIIKYSTP